jgi:polyhydroxybutyrate depolymerase
MKTPDRVPYLLTVAALTLGCCALGLTAPDDTRAQTRLDEGLAPAAAGPTVALSTNKLTYQEGDLHVLSGAASSPVPLTVDVYVVAQAPWGETFSVVGSNQLAPGIAPYLSGVALAGGFNFASQPIFSGQVPALPPGTYTWFAAFTAAGTSTLVSNLAQVKWVYGSPGYLAENRVLASGGVPRAFVLARPGGNTAGLPLVIALHGDGGNGTLIRQALPIENHLLAVFAYPDAPDGTFEYYTASGRAAEAQFTLDLIAALSGELGIDTARVFVAGLSGGATLANALGCRLGPGVIRGLGLHSGTLYPVDDDFTYTEDGGVSCPLPPAAFIWGTADVGAGTSYEEGQAVRDNYLATQDCAATTTPVPPSPCVAYDGCGRAVLWCAIEGLGHDLWPGAAGAFATFFNGVP